MHTLGGKETDHAYHHERINFAGDCVYNTQAHFVAGLNSGETGYETGTASYANTLAVQEAVYQSAQTGRVEPVQYHDVNT